VEFSQQQLDNLKAHTLDVEGVSEVMGDPQSSPWVSILSRRSHPKIFQV
jgi:hypothetical protein